MPQILMPIFEICPIYECYRKTLYQKKLHVDIFLNTEHNILNTNKDYKVKWYSENSLEWPCNNENFALQ